MRPGRGAHAHSHDGIGTHCHGIVDPQIAASAQGLRAVTWGFVGLSLTALLQMAAVWLSGSVALLADTIHNIGDAATAIPLWIAFTLDRAKPNRRFPFGYGRLEDLAGVAIVLTILASAALAGFESIRRIFHPREVTHLPAVAAAALIGFLGNELVAFYRMKMGKKIQSAALVADGYHARVDGFTSLGVLAGAAGVWLGFPLADPLVGLVITALILWIVWKSAKTVFTRMLDGVEPETLETIRHAAAHVPQVASVAGVRARWVGHRLHAEVNIAVEPEMTVAEGHAVAKAVSREISHHLTHMDLATIHVEPTGASCENRHEHSTGCT